MAKPWWHDMTIRATSAVEAAVVVNDVETAKLTKTLRVVRKAAGSWDQELVHAALGCLQGVYVELPWRTDRRHDRHDLMKRLAGARLDKAIRDTRTLPPTPRSEP